jgi:predicted phage terminase large subunit-like protein
MSSLSHAEYEFILQRDLMSFVERSFYELNPQAEFFRGFHIEAMAAKLEACRLGHIKRLIVNLPPRSLKSHCVSVAFPGWLLGHDPSIQIICASYGQDLADKHARDSRTLMASSFYKRLFPTTRLSLDRQAVNDFLTTAQGFRMATSVGGVLTGRGSDFIIVDDPQKPDEALSETRRKSVNDWYDNTLLSRLNSKETGVIIIVMQRLHEDDLVGHVLEQGRWEVLSLPAIAEEDETHVLESPLGRRVVTRKQGEALQPERESKATLISMRETIGSYNFASQYQQSPVPLGGAMVKTDWLRYYEPNDLPERFSSVVQSWDTANKSGELNDYSVCTTWGVYDRRYYLLDILRMRLNYPALKRAVREQARRHKPNRIVIEDKASGTQLIQDLKNDGVFGIEPFEPLPHCDKIVRLHAQTAEFERGGVLLPRFAPWLADYVRELTSFPGSKYDDQVDSTTQALEYLRGDSLDVWVRLAQ